MPDTTVLLVHYNNVPDTAACLASLAEAGAPDVIVVDNASQTGSIGGAIASYPGHATCIRLDENVGFGRANNVGIAEVVRRGSARVFVLNNDTLLEPNAIDLLEAALDRHPEAALVTPRILYADAPAELWYGGGSVDWSRGTARTPGYNGPADAPLALRSRPVTFASGCAMLLRTSALQEVGGFDPRYFMYEEDVELCLRLGRAGWSLWYESAAVIYHRVGGSQRAASTAPGRALPLESLPFQAYHQTRNQLVTAGAHARGLDLARFAWGFGARRVALVLRTLARGHVAPAIAVWRGLASGVAAVVQAKRPSSRPAHGRPARPAAEL